MTDICQTHCGSGSNPDQHESNPWRCSSGLELIGITVHRFSGCVATSCRMRDQFMQSQRMCGQKWSRIHQRMRGRSAGRVVQYVIICMDAQEFPQLNQGYQSSWAPPMKLYQYRGEGYALRVGRTFWQVGTKVIVT